MSSHSTDIDKARLVSLSTRTAIFGPIAANIAFVMELTLVPLLLPAIQLQFGLSISELAWVFNSYGIAVALGVLAGGWLGDTFNTRKVFGCGVAFFAAGSLIVAASESFDTLIIGRVIQGLGGGIFSPLVPLLLTRASPNRPGRMLIVWGSVAGYVAAFAPLFYGNVLGEQSWNIAFAFNASIAIIALAVLLSSPIKDDPVQYVGAKKDRSGLFRARNLWLTYVYVFCSYGCITYYLFQLPIWMSTNEIHAAHVGLVLSVMWLTFSCLSTLLRNMVDKPLIRPIMLAAPLLIAAAIPLLFYTEILVLILVSAILVGSGLACSNAPSTQLILRFAPKGMSAVSTSLDITFARVGGIATVAFLAETKVEYAVATISILCLLAAASALTVCKPQVGET